MNANKYTAAADTTSGFPALCARCGKSMPLVQVREAVRTGTEYVHECGRLVVPGRKAER